MLARIEELRTSLQARHPAHLAELSGASFQPEGPENGLFHLPVWEQEYTLSYPELVARGVLDREEANSLTQALMLYYFYTADGVPESRRWISFSELPDGRFYAQAFQGYTGNELVKKFKDNQVAFEHAAEKCAGSSQPFGDIAYSFKLFPRFSILAVFWQGDEDFPSNIQVQFDATAPHYLPTDACAVAGSMLTRKLIQAGT